MRRLIPLLAILVFATGCATQGANINYADERPAGDQPNLLIMGEDADRDTVPRIDRVFKRVLDALAEEMNREGFSVYDETAVSLDGFKQGRVRRTDAEIIDIARSIKRPPIDVAVIFSIYTSAQNLGYTRKLRTRIEGRLLNVQSGQRLGNFEVDAPEATNVAPDCDRRCRLEAAGSQARALADDLGAVLARKLDWLAPRSRGRVEDRRRDTRPGDDRPGGLSTAYALVFKGFENSEIDDIERIITRFRGYEHHRVVSGNYRTQEYWYETVSGSARLNRNLRQMLDNIEVAGRVVFAGNTFTVERIGGGRSR